MIAHTFHKFVSKNAQHLAFMWFNDCCDFTMLMLCFIMIVLCFAMICFDILNEINHMFSYVCHICFEHAALKT